MEDDDFYVDLVIGMHGVTRAMDASVVLGYSVWTVPTKTRRFTPP